MTNDQELKSFKLKTLFFLVLPVASIFLFLNMVENAIDVVNYDVLSDYNFISFSVIWLFELVVVFIGHYKVKIPNLKKSIPGLIVSFQQKLFYGCILFGFEINNVFEIILDLSWGKIFKIITLVIIILSCLFIIIEPSSDGNGNGNGNGNGGPYFEIGDYKISFKRRKITFSENMRALLRKDVEINSEDVVGTHVELLRSS